jgi:feruloyl esterase
MVESMDVSLYLFYQSNLIGIKFTDMAYGTELGFVTVGSDNGHNGNSAKFFLDSPEVMKDYGWRSYLLMTLVAKQVANVFYRTPVKYSYAYGCSTGGRQALHAAQLYPEVFDGFAGGDATTQWSDLNSWSSHFLAITGNWREPSFVQPQLWIRVHDEVIKQCDPDDGVIDHIISDPHKCKFDPTKIRCTPTSRKYDCLTDAQIETVKKIYEPFYGADGKEIYSRVLPGSEGGRSFIYFDGYPNSYATDWFRYAVYSNPEFTPRNMTLKDVKYAEDKDPGGTSSWLGDLTKVKSGKKKIITWHGLMDSIIPSDQSIKYYEHVRETMNQTYDEMDGFFRHFRVPGMDHCDQGPGATAIGQFTSPPAVKKDPNRNPLMAIVRWVEQGIPPETILGSKYDKDKKVILQRHHCKWPLQSVYKKLPDVNWRKADAWSCELPEKWFENGQVL